MVSPSPPRSPVQADEQSQQPQGVVLDPADLVRGLSDSDGEGSPRRKRRRLRRGGEDGDGAAAAGAGGRASPSLSDMANGRDGEDDGEDWGDADGVREEHVEEDDVVDEEDDDFGEQAEEVGEEVDELDIAQRERQYFSEDEEEDDGEDLLGDNIAQCVGVEHGRLDARADV